MVKMLKNRFFLQWHLTTKCNLNCTHCYRTQEQTYKKELENELDINSCFKIIDNFSNIIKRWNMDGAIHYTGGEALLRKDVFDIIKYTRKKGIEVRLMTNGIRIEPDLAKKIQATGIKYVQISIDGLPETHDKFRGKNGLFNRCLESLKYLKQAGCSPSVSTTISKVNNEEIESLIDIVSQSSADRIGFGRLVPIGSGNSLKDQVLTPQELCNLYQKISQKISKTNLELSKRDPLWALYDNIKIAEHKDKIFGGCTMGYSQLTILADGTVLPCRRLPIEIGKVPEQTLDEIFIGSKLLNDIRVNENLEKCSDCEYISTCRGCKAISYALTGNYLAKDPQCWKE